MRKEDIKNFLRPTKLKVLLSLVFYFLMPFITLSEKCYGILCPKITFFGGILVLKETSRELTQGIPSDFFIAIIFQLVALAIPYLLICILIALYEKLKFLNK